MSHLDSARVDTLVFPEQQRAAQVATPGGHRQPRTPWKTLHKSTVRRRVPVLLQMNAVECGAACLAMILTYYGRQTGISEIREQCGIGRDGLSAFGLVKAARTYGMLPVTETLSERIVSLPMYPELTAEQRQ